MTTYLTPKTIYIGTGIVALFVGYKLIKPKPKQVPVQQPAVIYLIDQNSDQLFSLMTLIAPVPAAFDKPIDLCNRIDKIPADQHIKVVLRTNGGALTSCEKILKKLKSHPGGYTAYIKSECFSAGTIIALGAKEIVMKNDSYLGKIDPQISSTFGSYPAIVYHQLPENCITDRTIEKMRVCEQVLNYMEQILSIIFVDDCDVKAKVREHMVYSNLPHNKTFDMEACKSFGLSVREPLT